MKRTIAFALGFVIGFALLLSLVYSTYRSERSQLKVWNEINKLADDEQGFYANVTLTNFDAVKREVTLRATFSYTGQDLLADDNYSIRHDCWLLSNTVKGKANEAFKKGNAIPPTEIVLAADGLANDYPFDRFDCDLNLQMGYNTEADGDVTMNTAVNITSVVPGLTVQFDKLAASEVPVDGCHITIQRSPTVKFFSIFINTVMWILSAVILSISLSCLVGGRKVELAMMTFMAGMLFAFPAVRNLQPGVPPLGSVTDFLATFWAQAIAAFGIASCGFVWTFKQK